MSQRYYVANLRGCGWERVSEYFPNVRQAQMMLNGLKDDYPDLCVVAERKCERLRETFPETRSHIDNVHSLELSSWDRAQ